MEYVLLIFLLVLIIFDLLKNKKVHTPGFVFNTMFFITLLLYCMYLSYVQLWLSTRTVWIITLFIISFNIPIFRNYYKKDKKIIVIKHRIPFRISEKKEMIIYYIALVVFILEVIYSKGCPLVWKIIGNGKTYFDFGIPSVNGMFYGLVILMGAY